jgi:DNA-3-methyladenine glycosylase
METSSEMRKPGREWFDRPVLELATALLGAHLTHRTSEGIVVVRIVEVEAYAGADDPGSHAYRGRTARNATMFGAGGHLYVYQHMGLHRCANIVAGPGGTASGCLLRAGEVVEGVELARARRMASGVTRNDLDLAQGPARLTVALGISRDDDGADLLDPAGAFALVVPRGAVGGRVPVGAGAACDEKEKVASGPRVGVSGEGGRPDLFPWRFWLDGDPYVSKFRAAASLQVVLDG